MNKISKDYKCTILWHVENMKISHVDPDIFSNILSNVDAEYGNIAKMTITQGKINKDLGGTID